MKDCLILHRMPSFFQNIYAKPIISYCFLKSFRVFENECVMECTDFGEIAFQGISKSKFNGNYELYRGVFFCLNKDHNLSCSTFNEVLNNVNKKPKM